jgi:sialate O-acetylesterase
MARARLQRYLALLVLAAAHCARAALLYPMFQDHAVLQRNRPIPVWGDTAPGATVTVTLVRSAPGATSPTAPARAIARAGADGRWRATLPALQAGGPYTLTAASSAGSRQTAGDILIGDVFLCSGQSNMEYPTRLASDYDQDVDDAHDSMIRLFHVQRWRSMAPRSTFGAGAGWRVTSPRSVRQFSAVCYFFGRDLQPALGVPVGLIEAAWGGSLIQAWIGPRTIRRIGGYGRYLDLLPLYARSPAAAWKRWDAIAAQWWRRHDPASAARPPWYAPAYDDASWRTIVPTGTWREWKVPRLETFNGLVWLRKDIVLGAGAAQQRAVLSLGPIDQSDIAWVNGVQIGASEGYDVPRVYQVPAGVLHAGRNLIALGVFGGAGPLLPGGQMTLQLGDGKAVRLSGKWRFRTSVPMSRTGQIPHVPWQNQFGLTDLHDGMISPLGETRVRGIVWYQGESDADQPKVYARLLPAMIGDWRRQFGADTPFLIVQLPGFGPYRRRPEPSDWARLREVQRQVAKSTPNAGLAVTIDVGSRRTIHPTDKQDVGRRLALLARALIYHQRVVGLSPSPIAAWHAGQQVRVRFDTHGGGLEAEAWSRPIGFQLCDRAGHCAFAHAVQHGADVAVSDAATPGAVEVRYCWADSPICNLYDRDGLPAVPFELPIGRAPRTGAAMAR